MYSRKTLEGVVLSHFNPWHQSSIDTDKISQRFAGVDAYRSAFAPRLLDEVKESARTIFEQSIACGRCYRVEQIRRIPGDRVFALATLEDRASTDLTVNSLILSIPCAALDLNTLMTEPCPPEKFTVCVVKSISGHLIELNCSLQSFKLWNKYTADSNEKVWLIAGPKIATFAQEYDALNELEQLNKPLLQAILDPSLQYLTSQNKSCVSIHSCDEYFTHLTETFNVAQAKAIQRSVTAANACDPCAFPFTLVQGPPGTGKTHTIWGILNILHLIDFQAYYESTLRAVFDSQIGKVKRPHILVCAPSNSAVDNILERIIRRGFNQKNGDQYRPALLRVGASGVEISRTCFEFCVESKVGGLLSMSTEEWRMWFSRQLHTVNSFENDLRNKLRTLTQCRHSTNQRESDIIAAQILNAFDIRDRAIGDLSRLERLRELHDKNRTLDADGMQILRSILEASFIDEAEIVFTTLASTGKRSFRECAFGFKTLIVDEAAQASEISILLPLFRGIQNCILIGDPQQLPATVLSQGAKNAYYDRSLFERITQNGINPILLSMQYRMHSEIRKFPSEHFYNNLLVDVVDMASSPIDFELLSSRSANLNLSPYVVFDTCSGFEERNDFGSIKNEFEAQLSFKLVQLVESAWLRDSRPNLALITPYAYQCQRLRQYAEVLTLTCDITVSTIDGFQGRESDFVILSCVRNTASGMGFMLDTRRLNVALTRAKFGLWILCSSHNSKVSAVWQALFDDAYERSCVINKVQLSDLEWIV